MKVRDDLSEAYRLAWEHIAQPGSWWTAAQRVELANTAIGAIRDIEPLPPWASVSAVEGRLPAGHAAPAVAHDATYRTRPTSAHRRSAQPVHQLAR